MDVAILGPLEVRDSGRTLPLGGLKQRAVLAILALQANRIVAAEALIRLIWGEAAPVTASHSLEVYVSALRRLLGGGSRAREILGYRAGGYALNLEPGQVDVGRFENTLAEAMSASARGDHVTATTRIRSALSLWRGSPLAEFSALPFGKREAERLEELRLRALEELFDCELALGHYQRVVPELEVVVAERPLRERLVGQLMVALYRGGRQDDASRLYQATRHRLVEEVGVEPGRELQLTLMKILRQDAALDVRPVSQDNLPAALTRFVGRSDEIERAIAIVGASRVVTLTGAGGVGKTRMALEVARRLAGDFRDGVFFIELASLADPSLVVATVAHAVGVVERADVAIGRTLVDHLRGQRALLVVDNCEHLITAVAELARELLELCPNLTILATSREALRIAGEYVLRVDPLSVAQSLQLFSDRVAMHSFEMTAGNRKSIETICERLGGIPLAIELAAARVKILAIDELATRLTDRLALLWNDDRTAPPRQATLRATIDWSYRLLSELEAVVFWRLSIFAARFTIADAEAVVVDRRVPSNELVALIAQLVDKSMVNAYHDTDGVTFGLLETLRQYGRELLDAAGELEEMKDRFVEHYLSATATADHGANTSEQAQWNRWTKKELDNLRNAIDWSRDRDSRTRLALAARAVHLMNRAGHRQEARARIETALRIDRTPSSELALALCRAAGAAVIEPDAGAARAYAQEALEIAVSINDKKVQLEALFQLAHAAYAEGDQERVRPNLELALNLARELGDVEAICSIENGLGEYWIWAGDWYQADSRLRTSLDLATELGVPMWIGDAANNLAVLQFKMGNLDQAQVLNADAFRAFESIADASKLAGCLDTSALIACKARRLEAAVRLMTVATSLRRLEGAERYSWWSDILDSELGRISDKDAVEGIAREARGLSVSDVIHDVIAPLGDHAENRLRTDHSRAQASPK
jgi:predicted ATPase/DNA-binding winged helix-turn-helix (wHTH) protein